MPPSVPRNGAVVPIRPPKVLSSFMPKSISRSRSMSGDDSSDNAGMEDDEKVIQRQRVLASNAAMERFTATAIKSCQQTVQGLADKYKKHFLELKTQNDSLQKAENTSRTRVEKLEQRYQQALEYNNSVSSENEDLNQELKKLRAELASAQETIKKLKAMAGVVAKKRKVVPVKKTAAVTKKKKKVIKRERSSSSSSSDSHAAKRRKLAARRRRGRSRSSSPKRRGRAKASPRRPSRRRRRSRSGSSSDSSSPGRKGKKGKGPAPPPPAKRNPEDEKKYVFKPGSLGVKCKGVLVHEVTPGGQAEALGIKHNWKIVEVNDKTVNQGNIRKALKQAILSGKPFTCTFNPTK